MKSYNQLMGVENEFPMPWTSRIATFFPVFNLKSVPAFDLRSWRGSRVATRTLIYLISSLMY